MGRRFGRLYRVFADGSQNKGVVGGVICKVMIRLGLEVGDFAQNAFECAIAGVSEKDMEGFGSAARVR